MNKGLTHVYFGQGKGKTSCAMGMALRAAGNGMVVRIFQFCKTTPSGECRAIEDLATVSLMRAEVTSHNFVWDMTPAEKEAWGESQQALFDEACEACLDKDVQLVILDEVLGAAENGALDLSQLLYLIDHRYKGTELVLTGRNAPEKLLEKADYATEMRMVKHPYNDGVHARKGIEF